ncbi:cobalamin biosynthesis protein CobG [Streptomyces katrae]|uniref:Cobalamin biosynthesis protein CobG n=1 Tax=Streptomyces katrae TaxID=68223 RepID=A0A0F4IN40_9ACTN|nr:cobalamin biosynthesis protein CobG [Streptomyces katrae]KJY22041.1 cobalamin biosynthesis protein CobG [Streptomyces katrae]
MLAAMPPQPPSAASRDEPVIRDRGDACPSALRLHAADDGYLARVRVPGGLLTVPQAAALGLAADRFGDGHLELTSRGNVQLRGLADGCGAGLAELLGGAGLLPAPSHERVRNIVATPLGGSLVVDWVRELDRLLCASTRAAALSGRFLFALDDGRGDVAALDPDVTVLSVGSGGSGAAGRAEPRAVDAVEVGVADAPRAALLAAEYFLDSADASGSRAWRVAELGSGDEQGLDAREFALRLRARGIVARYVPEVAWPYAEPPRPWGEYGAGLCVLPPLGRLSSAQWRVLAEAAGGADGELRLTPWRSVILPRAAAGAAGRVEAAGLAVRPGSPWLSVTACTGRPGCAKSLADVRADARAVVAESAGGLPVHWSGCARRCGHPRGTAWVDLVATPDGYELDGGPVPHADLAAALTAARTTPTTTEAATEAAVKK